MFSVLCVGEAGFGFGPPRCKACLVGVGPLLELDNGPGMTCYFGPEDARRRSARRVVIQAVRRSEGSPKPDVFVMGDGGREVGRPCPSRPRAVGP